MKRQSSTPRAKLFSQHDCNNSLSLPAPKQHGKGKREGSPQFPNQVFLHQCPQRVFCPVSPCAPMSASWLFGQSTLFASCNPSSPSCVGSCSPLHRGRLQKPILEASLKVVAIVVSAQEALCLADVHNLDLKKVQFVQVEKLIEPQGLWQTS